MGNCCFNTRRAAVWADGDEWEEEFAAERKAAKSAEAAAKMDRRVEVKIRVTKRQLQELLEKARRGCDGGGKGKAEDVLAELMTSGRVCCQQQHEEMRGRSWRPALYSIPEAAAAEES